METPVPAALPNSLGVGAVVQHEFHSTVHAQPKKKIKSYVNQMRLAGEDLDILLGHSNRTKGVVGASLEATLRESCSSPVISIW